MTLTPPPPVRHALGRAFRVPLGLARHELAVSVRTPALWVVPGLWAASGALGMRGPMRAGLGLASGFENLAGEAYFVGLLAAALAVTLPGRTRAAGAEGVVAAQPDAAHLPAGRVLAALLAATALVLCAPLALAALAALRGLSFSGAAVPLALYLALLLPAAWAGAALGLLAGSVLRDGRLALLAVFAGGVALYAATLVSTTLSPVGALDVQVETFLSLSSGAWPFAPLIGWHVLTLAGLAGLLAAAACGFPWLRTGSGRLASRTAFAALLAGVVGYGTALAGFVVAPAAPARAPTAPPSTCASA